MLQVRGEDPKQIIICPPDVLDANVQINNISANQCDLSADDDLNKSSLDVSSYLSLHLGPALLLLLAPPHVLVLLLSLTEGLQELVEDAKELVRLHLAGVLAKVLDCLEELRRRKRRGWRWRKRRWRTQAALTHSV